jgi:hypothetical protein
VYRNLTSGQRFAQTALWRFKLAVAAIWLFRGSSILAQPAIDDSVAEPLGDAIGRWETSCSPSKEIERSKPVNVSVVGIKNTGSLTAPPSNIPVENVTYISALRSEVFVFLFQELFRPVPFIRLGRAAAV